MAELSVAFSPPSRKLRRALLAIHPRPSGRGILAKESEAEVLVQKTGLRTLNALHVASALTFQAASGLTIPFVTADVRQREAAGMFALNLMWVE